MRVENLIDLRALATFISSAGTSKHRVPHTGSMLNNDIQPTIPVVAEFQGQGDLAHEVVLLGAHLD